MVLQLVPMLSNNNDSLICLYPTSIPKAVGIHWWDKKWMNWKTTWKKMEIKVQRINWHRNECPVIIHLVLSFLLGKGERKTVSVSFKIYVKLSKGTEQASCSEEVQLFQIGRSEGGFSHGPLEIRCRVIGAYGFSLFRLLPFLPVRFQLSAGSLLLKSGMPHAFMFQSRIKEIEEAELSVYPPSNRYYRFSLKLRC